MLAKFNRVVRKLSIPINIFNIIIGLLVGIAHVYLPFTSLFGLVLGVLMAISGSISMGISYWFTSKNSETHNTISQEARPALRSTRESKTFLAVALPMLLLNTASSFFGMYTGTLLLAAALSFAISPPVTVAIAVVLSSFLSVGTLINSWLQTHYVWETLKKPLAGTTLTPDRVSQTPSLGLRQKTELEKKETPRPNLKDDCNDGRCFSKKQLFQRSYSSPALFAFSRDREDVSVQLEQILPVQTAELPRPLRN